MTPEWALPLIRAIMINVAWQMEWLPPSPDGVESGNERERDRDNRER